MVNPSNDFHERELYQNTVYLLTNMPANTVEKAILTGDINGISTESVRHKFSQSLGIKLSDFTYFQTSGNSTTLRQHLDWLLSFSRCYARVRLVLEADDAAAWFLQVNRHLDGQTPLFYLETRTGERHLRNYLHNLLNGNFA